MKWRDIVAYVAMGLFAATVIAMIIFGVRSLTQVTTPIKVYQVEPGRKCAMATSSDGVALSCWKSQ